MADEKKKEESKKKVRRPQAQKRDIQSAKRNLRNRSFKASVTTAIRSFQGAVSAGDAVVLKQKLNDVYSLLDKGVKNGVFKLNKVSRTKSRLTQKAKI